jgi:HAE1 family hydrophobic/amphiphilic exporter-1
MLFGVDLNLYAFVGVIMLVGLVKKNGIMMIDFAIEAQRKEQVAVGGDVRGLPRALPPDHDDDDGRCWSGTLPIALGSAPAPKPAAAWPGRRRRPRRVSQTLTLFITPVFYPLHGSAGRLDCAATGPRCPSVSIATVVANNGRARST